MEEPLIYLDILQQELTQRHLQEILSDFFQRIQVCVEEVIEGLLENNLTQIQENLKTIQILASSMYAPYIAEFALLCESYTEQGRESCLKETFVLLFKQITLVKKECHEYM